MSAFSNYSEIEVRKAQFRTSTVTVRAIQSYAVGDRVMLGTSDLSVYECIQAGTTSGTPTFNTGIGSTTGDGTVIWLTCKQGLPKRQLYVSLHTVLMSAGGGETGTGTEVTGGNYIRAGGASSTSEPTDANWSAPDATGGLTANVNDIVFNAPTANWGSILGFGIWDRSTGGNILYFGDLTTPKTVNNGDPAPRFPAGSLTITFA